MKFVVKFITICLAVSLLTSCDLLCRLAGKPTKEELRVKKIEHLAAQMQKAKAQEDSLAALAAVDTVAQVAQAVEPVAEVAQPVEQEQPAAVAQPVAQETPKAKRLAYRYYVVLGVHRDTTLATQKVRLAQKKGFEAQMYYKPSTELYYVLVGGTNDINEAAALKHNPELERITSNIWIFYR